MSISAPLFQNNKYRHYSINKRISWIPVRVITDTGEGKRAGEVPTYTAQLPKFVAYPCSSPALKTEKDRQY